MPTVAETNLQQVIAGLQGRANAALAQGDMASYQQLSAALTQAMNALNALGNQEIDAYLANVQDPDKTSIVNMVAKMNAAAAKINSQQTSMQDAINIGLSCANVILDATSGNIPAAINGIATLSGLGI